MDNLTSESFTAQLQEYICELALSGEPLRAFAETFRMGLAHNADLTPLVRVATGEELDYIVDFLVEHYGEPFTVLVCNYDWPRLSESGDNGFFRLVAYAKAAVYLHIYRGMKTAPLYGELAKAAAEYVGGVYNTELLNETDVAVLPPLMALGYYAGAGQGVKPEYAFEYAFVLQQ